MADHISRLIARLEDQVTRPAGKITASLDRLRRASELNVKRMDALRGQMIDAVAAGYALAKALSAPVKAAMEFESAMADVRKVVDFDTPESFKAFQQDLKAMAERVPMATNELAKIAAAAGQADIPRAELLAFTELAAKVGVAFDISAGQAGEALAKMKTALGLSLPQVGLLSDAMNHLSNSMASSAPDILDVVRRVGAQAKQFGFSATQVAAFASAMTAAGAESDVAATSFRNMGKALTRGDSATKSQRGAYADLKLDPVKVAKDMQKDAVGTTMDVLRRIAKLPAYMQAAVSSDLFGDEARALGPLLTNLPLLEKALALVADGTKYAGSANAEYEVRAKTFANAVQLLKNRLENLAIAIGTALLPRLNAAIDAVSPLIVAMRRLAEANPTLVANAILAASGLIAFRVATIAARFGLLFMRGALIDASIAALSLLRGVVRLASALVIGPAVRLATAAVLGLRSALIGFAAASAIVGRGAAFGMLARSALGLLNPLRLMSGAIYAVGVALRFAFIASGVGAVIAAIAAAGLLIYNNWSGLVAFFQQLGESFMASLGPQTRGSVEGIVSAVGRLVEWVTSLFDQLTLSDEAWGKMGDSAGKALASAVDSVAQTIEDILGYLADLPRRAIDAIGSIDLSGIFKWPEFPSLLGGGTPSPALPQPLTGHRPRGGRLNVGRGTHFDPPPMPRPQSSVDYGALARPQMGGAQMAGAFASALALYMTPAPAGASPGFGSVPSTHVPARAAAAVGAPAPAFAPPPAPAAPQVDLESLNLAGEKARDVGEMMQEYLGVSIAPTVDTASMMQALDLARQLNAELARAGTLAAQAEAAGRQKVKGFNVRSSFSDIY